MNVAVRTPMTSTEFLAWEERQDLRHEFDGLTAVAMTGGTVAHNRIVFNLRTALEARLTPPCAAFSTEIKIQAGPSIRYPDVLVTCTAMRPTDTIAKDPVIVFEVISGGNPATDRIIKVTEYFATPSIQKYVILEQRSIGATVLTRHADGWLATAVQSGENLALPEVGIEFPLDACYARLDFERSPDDGQ